MKVKILKIRVSENFLQNDQELLNTFLRENEVVNYQSAFVNGDDSYWSVIFYYDDCKTVREALPESDYTDFNLSSIEEKLLESLKNWRTKKAKGQKLPVYCIATNKELQYIAKTRPAKKEELLDIKGFGKHKIENYGEEMISIIDST